MKNRKEMLRYLKHGVAYSFFTLFLINPEMVSGQGNLRAGVAKVNITPNNSQTLIGYGPRKSEGVRDSIYHKVIVLDDGKQQFYLVSSDLAAIAPPTYHNAADKLKKLYNIDKENFWWTNTHTHSAPEVGPGGVITLFLGERYQEAFDKEYTDFVEDKLIQAVAEARKNLSTARLGVGWGFSRANINRRARDIDNKTFLGENPDGPIDRRIGLLRIETEKGIPLALIANYPIHGTVLSSSDLRISGDVPGVVAQYIEEQTGAPLFFINGAEGNIAPRLSVSISNSGNKDNNLKQFRKLLGDKILEANRNITSTTNNVTFKTGRIIVETPLREDVSKDWPKNLNEYYRISHSGDFLIKIPVSFLFINDEIGIWSAPLELFCEVSNKIREASAFPFTFYYGIANGTLGYLPTKEEFELGGYEPMVSPFSPKAAEHLSDAVINYLDDKSRKK